MSRGTLLPASDASAVAATGKVNFSWTDNSDIADASDTDLAMPLIVNVIKGEVLYDTAAAMRSDAALSFTTPASWVGDTLHVYLGFITADGRLVANSAYLGSITAA